MRILGLTDIHGVTGTPGSLPKADLVLIAGDITHFGDHREAERVLRGLGLPDVPVLAVPGNCDGTEVSRYLEDMDMTVDGLVRDVDGCRVYGIGGALQGPAHTPRELTERDFEDQLERLADNDGLEGGILVSHQPPAKTKLDKALGFRHVGSRAVRSFIERTRPILCLTGHIHESAGQDILGNTVIINPGPFRHGSYALCTLENGKVTCTIDRV